MEFQVRWWDYGSSFELEFDNIFSAYEHYLKLVKEDGVPDHEITVTQTVPIRRINGEMK